MEVLALYIDENILTLLYGIGCAVCGFYIHKNYFSKSRDEIVSDTIEYLCEQGFVKHNWDENGEIVLHPYKK